MNEYLLDGRMSREEVIERLFADGRDFDINDYSKDIFDNYGNYAYPSETVLEVPNIAYGTAYYSDSFDSYL